MPAAFDLAISAETELQQVTNVAYLQGLEHTDLIKLKRTVSKQKTSAAAAAAMRNIKGEAFISRRSSGMSFDFNKHDGRIYIAGTEDGHIYKCSTSYSEQYLETYSGHLGPVYSVQWSPFQSNLFISSSADWSVKLWTEGKVGREDKLMNVSYNVVVCIN